MRCKHQQGILSEIIRSVTTYDVTDGVPDKNWVGFHSDGEPWEYTCRECGMYWIVTKNSPKWLRRIVNQILVSEEDIETFS